MILNEARSSNKASADALTKIGVHVYSVPGTMHEKFAVVNTPGKTPVLLNGSANWSNSAEARYSENTVVYDRHPHLVRQFDEEYNRLLAKAKGLTPDADALKTPIELGRRRRPPSPSAPCSRRRTRTARASSPTRSSR